MTTTPKLRHDVVALDMGGVVVDVDKDAPGRRLRLPFARIEPALFGSRFHPPMSQGAPRSVDAFIDHAVDVLSDVPRADVIAAWSDVVSAKSGAVDVVRRLRRPAVAWSNTDPLHFARFSAQLPQGLFSAQRCLSFEVGADKPDLAFYRAGLAKLDGVAADRVLFIDDKDENVAAARQLGIDAHRAEGLAAVVDVLQRFHLLDA